MKMPTREMASIIDLSGLSVCEVRSSTDGGSRNGLVKHGTVENALARNLKALHSGSDAVAISQYLQKRQRAQHERNERQVLLFKEKVLVQ